MTELSRRTLPPVLALLLAFLPAAAISEPYRVKEGDRLADIAMKYHVTVRDLQRTNHIRNVNRIYAGTVLIIPERTATRSRSTDQTRRAGVRTSEATSSGRPASATGTSSQRLAERNDEIHILRVGLERGWIVTRNEHDMIFVHTSSSGGMLTGLRYVVRESADHNTWTVYKPAALSSGGTAYGRSVGVIPKPANVTVGTCNCR